MYTLFMLLILFLSAVIGIWILLLMYGVRNIKGVIISFQLAGFMPYFITRATQMFMIKYRQKHNCTRLEALVVTLRALCVCVVVIPIAFNDAFNHIFETQVTKRMRKEASLKKANEKICVALSDAALQHYAA